MRRSALALLALLAATPAMADDDFIGLYQGIHLGNGSVDLVSITPGGGGRFAIAEHASVFGACPGPDQSATTVSEGYVDGNDLLRKEGKATCIATGTTVDLRDGRYLLSHGDDLLTLRVPDHADIIYHRISD